MLTRGQLKEIEQKQSDPREFDHYEDHFHNNMPDINKKAIKNELGLDDAQIKSETEDVITQL